MNNQLSRIKELINYKYYGTINEEIQTSLDFNKENFIEDKNNKAIHLNIGIDKNNEKKYALHLTVLFYNKEELVFYFAVTDKNNQLIPGLNTIYDRKIADKYIPDELKGSGKIKDKIIKMTQKLLNMENPARFIIETFDKYSGPEQLEWHRPIINLILDNGYNLTKQDVNVFGKYYWEFIKEGEKTKEQIKESVEFSDWAKNHKRDEEWHKRMNEKSMRIWESLRERGLIKKYE